MSFEFDFRKAVNEFVSELPELFEAKAVAANTDPNYKELITKFGDDYGSKVIFSRITTEMSVHITVKVLEKYHKELNSYLENRK